MGDGKLEAVLAACTAAIWQASAATVHCSAGQSRRSDAASRGSTAVMAASKTWA
ncbi:MAG: hypothetical protein K0S14_1145 [Thermomicrobiales bacterium]|nr:hypothetical protein [Thermomicrobiales bacterium]